MDKAIEHFEAVVTRSLGPRQYSPSDGVLSVGRPQDAIERFWRR
jgi:hypothetical protein